MVAQEAYVDIAEKAKLVGQRMQNVCRTLNLPADHSLSLAADVIANDGLCPAVRELDATKKANYSQSEERLRQAVNKVKHAMRCVQVDLIQAALDSAVQMLCELPGGSLVAPVEQSIDQPQITASKAAQAERPAAGTLPHGDLPTEKSASSPHSNNAADAVPVQAGRGFLPGWQALCGFWSKSVNSIRHWADNEDLFAVLAIIITLPTIISECISEAVEERLAKVAKALVILEVSAANVTLGMLCACLAASGLLAFAWHPGTTWCLMAVAAVMLVRLAIDNLDLLVAEESGHNSKGTQVLKAATEPLCDLALLLGFYFSGLVWAWLPITIGILMLLHKYLLTIAFEDSAEFERDSGFAMPQAMLVMSMSCFSAVTANCVFGYGSSFFLNGGLLILVVGSLYQIFMASCFAWIDYSNSNSAPHHSDARGC